MARPSSAHKKVEVGVMRVSVGAVWPGEISIYDDEPARVPAILRKARQTAGEPKDSATDASASRQLVPVVDTFPMIRMLPLALTAGALFVAAPTAQVAPKEDPGQFMRVELWNSGVPLVSKKAGAQKRPGQAGGITLDSVTPSLGTGGLRKRSEWLAAGRRVGASRYETRGGVRIEAANGMCTVVCPEGTRFTIDGRGRFHAGERVLTRYLASTLQLRFLDGCELRIEPGSEEDARRISVIENDLEHVLVRQGRADRGMSRSRHAQGRIWYVTGAGDEVVSLALAGPFLLVRPILVQGRSKRPRVILIGDFLRAGARLIAEKTPKRRVQYPTADKIAHLLVDVSERIFPHAKVYRAATRSTRGLPLTLAFGRQIRVDLTPHGREGFGGLACGLRLAPDAERSLEFVVMSGRTTVHRVLPKVRQRFSRYLGRGLRFDAVYKARLPWDMPLATLQQRRKTLRKIQPWLVRPDGVQASEASLRR